MTWATWIVVFLVSLCGTGVVRVAALRWNLLDIPNTRSSHAKATPRSGGLAIVFAVLTFAAFAKNLDRLPDSILVVVLASLVVAMAGLADDRFNLPASGRLLIQLAMACTVVVAAPQLSEFETPWMAVLTTATAVLAIAWCTNLYNFMDGIDGIAAQEAVFLGASGGWLCATSEPTLAALFWATAIAALGFMPWNWSPARIFMGDVGSGFLGFLLAAAAFLAISSLSVALPVWLILWSAFLADASVTLMRRMLRGEQWWSAHRSHAYQHLARRFDQHGKVSAMFAGINWLLLAPLAVAAHHKPLLSWPIAMATLFFLGIAAVVSGAGQKER